MYLLYASSCNNTDPGDLINYGNRLRDPRGHSSNFKIHSYWSLRNVELNQLNIKNGRKVRIVTTLIHSRSNITNRPNTTTMSELGHIMVTYDMYILCSDL